jgi:hypothetical protein
MSCGDVGKPKIERTIEMM